MPSLGFVAGLDHDYLFSDETLWKLDRVQSGRVLPALKTLCGSSLFFTTQDAADFCSFVLPELGRNVTIEDPERLLLNRWCSFIWTRPGWEPSRPTPSFCTGRKK